MAEVRKEVLLMLKLRTFLSVCVVVLMMIPSVMATSNKHENISTFKPKLEWVKFFGKGLGDGARSVVIDNSGCIYVSVYANSYKYGAGFLLKYSPSGDLLWNISWVEKDEVLPWGIALGHLGVVYLVGRLYNNITKDVSSFIRKYDVNGIYQWNKTWNNGSSYAFAYGVGINSKDEIFVSGAIQEPTKLRDVFLLKYTADGNMTWNQTWGGIYEDVPWDMSISSSDNIYLGGYKNDTAVDDNKILTLKYDSNGIYQWHKEYGAGGCFGYGINVTSSEDIYVAGRNPSGDTQLLKYNKSGDLIWHKEWNDGTSNELYGVATSNDANFVYATGFSTPMILLKYDKDGNFIWNTSWANGADFGIGYGVSVNKSGEIYVVGNTGSGGPNMKAFIIKYIEISVPEFTTIILPLTVTIALFIVIIKRRKKAEWMPRSP